MERFFGMMPANEVKREGCFVVDGTERSKVFVEAGENGWTITYADYSTEYKDEVDTVDSNFLKAVEVLKTRFDVVEETKFDALEEEWEEE